MTRQIEQARRATGDGGFSLLEVVLAMVVLLVALLGLSGLFLANFTSIGQARERQSANQLAQDAMESLRSMPFPDLQAGSVPADLAADIAAPVPGTVSLFQPAAGDYRLYSSTGDQVVAAAPALPGAKAPLARPAAPVRLGGTDYWVRAYVTRSTINSQQVLQGNAVVVWRSARGPQRYAVQTTLTSDIGCSSSATHPFAGPCQSFFYATSDLGDPVLSVATVTGATALSTPGVAGELHAGRSLSQTQTEQVSLSGSSAGYPWAAVGASGTAIASPLTDPASLTADDDPASETIVEQPAGTTYTMPSVSMAPQGGITAAATRTSGDQGALRALAGGSACQTADVTPGATPAGARCASSSMVRAALSLSQSLTGGLGAATLASFASPSAQSRTFTAVSPLTTTGVCTATAGSRCATSRARRVLPELTAGGFPWTVVDTEVSALRVEESTTALTLEAGPGSSPASFTRTNSSGGVPRLFWRTSRTATEVVVPLTGQGTLLLASATDSFTYGGRTVNVTITPSLTAPPPLVQTTPVCTVTCQASVQLAPLLQGTLDYRINDSNAAKTLLGHWTIKVTPSAASVSVRYQQAPSA